MGMTAGSVSVADAGTHSGTGIALAAYEDFVVGADEYADWQNAENAKTCKQLAGLITAITAAIVAELKANGEAVILAGDTGLQTTTNVGVATDGPAAEKRIGLD
jgi:hypothetical protein